MVNHWNVLCCCFGYFPVILFCLIWGVDSQVIENSKKLPMHPFIVSYKGLMTVQTIAQIPDFFHHFLIWNKFILQVTPSVPFAKCLWQFPWPCMECSVVGRNCCSSGHGRGPWHFFRVFWPQSNKEFLSGVALDPQIWLRPFILDKLHCDNFYVWRTNWTGHLFTTLTVLIQMILAIVASFLKQFSTLWSRIT